MVLVGLAAGLTAAGLGQGPGQGPAKPRTARTVAKSRKKPPAAQPPSQAPLQIAPQAPPQPVAPPRPDQMAPVAPLVTYQNGQLSIQAQNSTLSSILSAVRARTGARLEMPADTASDRVAAQLGPGNPRDVLASLLRGSRFDYIVIGSPTDPDALSQVILTPHTGSGGVAPANAAAYQLPQGRSPQPTMPGIAGGAARPEINGDEDETAAEPEPEPQPPPPQPAPPQGVVGSEQPGQPNSGLLPGGETGQPKPKTPEQLLQELQKMQQQQQTRQDPQKPQQQ
jgi:hypothetical protein